MGKLNVFCGSMKSGKSIDLMRTAYNYEENNYRVLIMKPEIDSKAGSCVETRIGLRRECDYLISREDKIIDILKGKLSEIKCIFIDEAQFLTERQVLELLIIAKSTDVSIICYSLRTNFMMKFFEGSAALLEKAESIEELKTLCTCGEIARYVGRKVNGEFVSEGEVVVIDGDNVSVEYIPLCAKCYLEQVLKLDLGEYRRVLYGKRENSN